MASSARKGPDVEAFKAADVIAFHLSEVFFAQLEGNKKAGCLSEIFKYIISSSRSTFQILITF